MTRDYKAIGKDIALNGFFSEYLPPCFSIDEKLLQIGAPPSRGDLINPYCYTMSRFDSAGGRRNIFIPEISSYLALYYFMRDNNIFNELIEFTESHGSCSFSPILGKDNTAYKQEQSYAKNANSSIELPHTESDYIDNTIEKIKRAQGASKIMKLDIANCFGSFYTHLVPAIILGLEKAEIEYENKDNSTKSRNTDTYKKYSSFDSFLRRQNQNRTNGLLAGPLISRMVVEGILCRIDNDLISSGVTFSRYVDDYEVYLYGNDQDRVEGIFIDILRRYSFSLNNQKTKTVDFPFYIVDNLEKIFDERYKSAIEPDELMSLFNTFSLMEMNGTKGSIRFLLKNLEKKLLSAKDNGLYKSYLLTIIENDSRSLSKACTLLIQNSRKLKLSTADKHIINGLVDKHLKLNHDFEVAWLVYVLAETKLLNNNKATIEKVVASRNELAQLLLLEKGYLDDEQIEALTKHSRSWIMLYELYARNHISKLVLEDKLELTKSTSFYEKMKTAGIRFCRI